MTTKETSSYIKGLIDGSNLDTTTPEGKIIAALRPGTKVTLLVAGRTWSQISYNGKSGWIKTRYLSKTK